MLPVSEIFFQSLKSNAFIVKLVKSSLTSKVSYIHYRLCFWLQSQWLMQFWACVGSGLGYANEIMKHLARSVSPYKL